MLFVSAKGSDAMLCDREGNDSHPPGSPQSHLQAHCLANGIRPSLSADVDYGTVSLFI